MQKTPPVETVDSLLQAAEAQVKANDISAAAVLVQRALETDSKSAVALNAAALIAKMLGNLDEAEAFARRATQEKPIAALVLTLADVLKAKGKFEEAVRYYRMILERVPKEVQSLTGLAEIFEQTGHRSLAIENYELALIERPNDSDLFHRFSKLVSYVDTPRVYAALERAKPADTEHINIRLNYVLNQARWKEYAERAKQGLPPHARTASDIFFTFGADIRATFEALVDTAIAEGKPEKYAAWKGMCLLARGERAKSAPYFQVRAKIEPNSLYANIVFDDGFYRDLTAKSDEALFGHFPELIEVVTPQFDDAPIIFLSCDYNYYRKFARTLLLSINKVAKTPQVHLHIMDAGDEQLAEATMFASRLENTKLAISSERTGTPSKGIEAARAYYHAIRFIRMYQYLKRYNKPLWQMDVDGLMHRDLRPTFDTIGDSDIALWGSPGRWEPWAQFNASLTGIRPTARGTEYLRLVAAYIADFYSRDDLHWGIDQLAMFCVYAYLKDNDRGTAITMLPSNAIDGEFKDEGLIWSNGGIGKFSPLQSTMKVADTPPDSPRLRYFEALKSYTDQL